ncbi:MAG TPA: T9SS type A sorting domain-containing protein, partial [Bacteroidetes bacterium]|nr:T9SS type A sorting domain-containing protein [Bacteroidota bacterium]
IVQSQSITNDFALQTPGGGLVASCDNYSGDFVLVGYYFTTYGPDEFSASGCNPVNVTQNYYLSIGNCCSNYAGGNIFEYEYRHWGIFGTAQVIPPPGYSFISANVRHYRTGGTQVAPNNYISSITPSAINGDTLVFDIANQFTSGGGPIPLGDDGYTGRIIVRLQPSCGVQSDTMQSVKYIWDFLPIPNLTGPGASSTRRIAIDSLFYEAPSLTINPVLPIAPGINSTISWDFSIENNSNTASADSTWFSLISPSNQVIPISVIDLITNMPLTSVNGIYQVGQLLPDSVRNFRIVSNYTNCAIDSLQIVAGWDCNTYPANLMAYTCTPATAWLFIDPQPSILQANLTLDPGPHDICDSLLVELEVVSAQLAGVQDIIAGFQLPLSGGLTYAPGSAEMLYPVAGTFAAIPDPVILGNAFAWNINTVNAAIAANDLPGTIRPDSNSFVIRFYLYTNCNMISGDRIRLRLSGNRVCGDPMPPVLLVSAPININGAVQPYQTQITAQSANISSCPISETISVQIINGGLGATSPGDSIFVNLSAGYTYQGNFIGQINPPALTNPSITSGPGGVRLGWESITGVAAGDTMSFTFEVDITDAVACGPDIINVQTVTNQTLFCASSMSNCTAATQTGSFNLNMNIQRPNLSFSGFSSTIQPIGGGYDYNYSGTIQNSGPPILGGTTTTIDFYCDSDQSGGYSPGDALLTSYTTTSGISSVSPHAFSGNFFIPLASCSDTNMIYGLIVPNSGAGYCICDTAFGNSNVVLPVEWLAIRGKALDKANELTWDVRVLPDHDFFLVEKQKGTNWEVISAPIATRQAHYTWLHSSPREREVYRIKATDQNGARSYSPTVEILRDEAINHIKVYPNPATSTVMLEAAEGTTFRIFNSLGQSVFEGNIGQEKVKEVHIGHLAAGVYMIEFRKGSDHKTIQLVVSP